MKKIITLLIGLLLSVNIFASHGLPIVGLTVVNTGTGITISGGSDGATCGSGPYWMQVEVTCSSGGLSGTPPATLQTILAGGAGGAQTFNSFPWFNSLLNLPNYNAPGWFDNCVNGEQYHNIVIPFAGLCPGQVYYFAVREWVSASNNPGPWSTVSSFTVPGTLIPLGLTLNANPQSFCPPGSSTLTASSTGNCGNNTIKWSNGSSLNSIVVSPAVTTVYTCTLSAPCRVSVIKSVTVVVSPTLTTIVNSTNATCGLSNGSATVTSVTGGTPTYSWSGGQTGSNISGLSPGSYSVITTDVNGCIGTNSLVISSVGSLTNNVTFTPPCFGGTNGTATSQNIGTYLWSNGQVTQTATNLGVGLVTLTLSAAGCTSTTSVFITPQPQLVSSITTTNVSCFGGTNGSAMTSPSGGAGTYTYSWNSTPVQTTQSATNLPFGTYSCTVSDANGCQIVVSANITQPSQLTISPTQTNISCFGGTNGSISVSGGGGTGTYLYSLNSGTNQTNPTFTNLSSGTYTVKITDVNSCSVTTTVTLTQPIAMSLTSTVNNVSCFASCDGSISVTPSGGVSPYTHLWSNSQTLSIATGLCVGTYTVVSKDLNNCQINNTFVITQPSVIGTTITPLPSSICIGQSSSLTPNIFGGTSPYTYLWSNGSTSSNISVSPTVTTSYTLTTTDSHSCVTTNSITVVVNPVLAITSISSPTSICVGQTSTLSANASGGNGGTYTFVWSTTDNGPVINVTPSTNTTYTVTVSDGCSPSVSSTVSVVVNQLPLIAYSTTTLSGCQPLTVTYTNLSSGGNCVWNINNVNYNNCNVTETFPNSGLYNSFLTLTDMNGCVSISPIVVADVYQMPVSTFSANPTKTDILNPEITFNNTSSPGSYTWDFGDGTTSTSQSPTHNYGDIGTYQIKLTTTTSNGCIDITYDSITVIDIFTVYVPNAFTPNGDGKNDTFLPVVSGAEKFTFWIYDRWGEMIFQSDGGSPWDGTIKGNIVQQDVYVWKLIVTDKRKVKYNYIGHVTILK